MQLLTIAGTVGKDSTIRTTNSGDEVLGFSVAVSNGKDKDATWYDCAIWGDRARKLEQHIKKGTRLTLYGRPTARSHEGKAYLGLNVDNFTFQSSAQQSGEGFSGSRDGGMARGGGGGDHSGSFGQGSHKESYDLNSDIPFITSAGII